MESHPISLQETLTRLPPEWATSLLLEIQQAVQASNRKLVVLDDDPTGTQTVHDVPVLTEWSIATLSTELARPDSPVFYVLTNSRSVPLPAAQTLNREIGRNLVTAAAQTESDFAVVSRSDSTLRGHYPGETDALVEALGIEVDASLLVPYFLEGGRYTIGNIHYVAEEDRLVPAAETPFAQDTAFGYRNSNLRHWVEEKTGGRVKADDVASLRVTAMREGGPQRVAEHLRLLPKGAVCIVNAVSMRDLEVFVRGLLIAEAQGKHYLYRTAASFVQVRAGIQPQPLLRPDQLNLDTTGGGLFVVGSYVPKTTAQVATLLAKTDVIGIEIQVTSLLDHEQQQTEIDRAIHATDTALQQGQDVALYTSRELVTGTDAASSLSIGQWVSESLVAIMRGISTRPRYLVAKGGITSSDIATNALDVRRAMVLGQVLPGIPVWKIGDESRHPGLPYIVFPGNVGGDDALVQIQQQLFN